MKLGTWLLSLAQPLVAKVLLALGFSIITITGFEIVIGQLKDMVIGGVNALPAEILGLFLLAGGGKALGLIFGAIATKMLLWKITQSTKILGVSTS